jgi:hypothetical protein
LKYCSGSLFLRIRANSITSRTLTPDIIITVYCDYDAFVLFHRQFIMHHSFLFASCSARDEVYDRKNGNRKWRQHLLYKYINARIPNTVDLWSFSQVKAERFRTVEGEKKIRLSYFQKDMSMGICT